MTFESPLIAQKSVNILNYCNDGKYSDINSIIYMHLDSNGDVHIKNTKTNNLIITKIKLRNTDMELILTMDTCKKYIKSSIVNKNTSNKQYISILKSCLQKTIRRKLIKKSLNIAYEFINIGQMFELLKRLCIIILEDCVLIKYFPLIVYFMIVSSKNILTEYVNNIILSIVEHICQINFVYLPHYSERHEYNIKDIINSNMNNNKKILLSSLLIRKCYGGMSCDVHMIDDYVHAYKKDKEYNNIIIKSEFSRNLIVKNYNLNFNKDKHLIKECIDFHCYPNIIKNFHNQFNIPENDLKLAIWYCRSSINKRAIISPKRYIIYTNNQKKYEEIYNIIKYKLDSLSENIIKEFNNF
jgi:hypothetical protein